MFARDEFILQFLSRTVLRFQYAKRFSCKCGGGRVRGRFVYETPADRADFGDVQALLEQTRDCFVPEIVKVKVGHARATAPVSCQLRRATLYPAELRAPGRLIDESAPRGNGADFARFG
jgi:hypothetical protein